MSEKKYKKKSLGKKKKRRIACKNKVGHKTFENAVVACKKLNKEKNLVAHPYLCKRCNFWHIGKPSFKDDPMGFWNNIFNKMSENDLESLKEK